MKYAELSGTASACSGPVKYAELSGTSSTCTGNSKSATYATISGTATNCSGGTASLSSNGLIVGGDQLVVSGGSVGVGTSIPTGAKLVVAGLVKISGGSPGINKVLTSDDSGLAVWQLPSTSAKYADLSGTASTCTGSAKYATLSGISSTCTGNANTSNYAILSGTASVCSGAAKYADLSGISSSCTGTSNYARYAWLSGTSTASGSAKYADLSGTATECAGSGYYLKSTGLKVGTNALYVDSGGNVGIGTTSPGAGLVIDRSNGFRQSAQGDFNVDASGIIGGRFKVQTDGNVGIGTNVPGSKLEVSGSYGSVNFKTIGEARFKGTDNYSHFNYSTGEDTYIRGGKSTSNVYIKDYSGGNVYVAGGGGKVYMRNLLTTGGNPASTADPYAADIVVGSDVGTRHDSSIMMWSSNSASRLSNSSDVFYGSVWNSSTPNFGLSATVGGGSYFKGNLAIGDGATNEQDIHYYSNAGYWEAGSNKSGNGTSGNQFYIYDANGGGYGLTVQRGTCNVGVGTNAPGYKLDVKGAVNATGGIYDNGTRISASSGKKMGGATKLSSSGSFAGWSTTYTAATDGFLFGTACIVGDYSNVQLYLNGTEVLWIYHHSGDYLYFPFCVPLQSGDTWRFERSNGSNYLFDLWWRPLS